MQMRLPKGLSAALSFEVTSSAVFRVLGGISGNVSGINSMRPKGNFPLLEEGQAAAGAHTPQGTRLAQNSTASRSQQWHCSAALASSLNRRQTTSRGVADTTHSTPHPGQVANHAAC